MSAFRKGCPVIVVGLLLVIDILVALPASANPVGGGTLTPVDFKELASGPVVGSVDGSFSFNSTLTAIPSWSIHVSTGVGTASNGSAFTYPDFTYTPANSTVTFNLDLALDAGNHVTTVDFRQIGYPAAGSHDLLFAFDQMLTSIPPGGATLRLCSDINNPCRGGGFQIPSGEFVTIGTTDFASRDLVGDFLTLSDPPNLFTLNFTATQVLIPNDGSTAVPAPGTLVLLIAGSAASLAVVRRRKERKHEE